MALRLGVPRILWSSLNGLPAASRRPRPWENPAVHLSDGSALPGGAAQAEQGPRFTAGTGTPGVPGLLGESKSRVLKNLCWKTSCLSHSCTTACVTPHPVVLLSRFDSANGLEPMGPQKSGLTSQQAHEGDLLWRTPDISTSLPYLPSENYAVRRQISQIKTHSWKTDHPCWPNLCLMGHCSKL